MRIARALLATSGTQEFIHNNNYDKITLITAISFQEKQEFISLKTTIWVERRAEKYPDEMSSNNLRFSKARKFQQNNDTNSKYK